MRTIYTILVTLNLLFLVSNSIAGVTVSEGLKLTGLETEVYLEILDVIEARAVAALKMHDDVVNKKAALVHEFQGVYDVTGGKEGDYIIIEDGAFYMFGWQVRQILLGKPNGSFEAKFMRANDNPEIAIYVAKHHDEASDLKETIRVEIKKDARGDWFIPFMSVASPAFKVDSSAHGNESIEVATGLGLTQWYGIVNFNPRDASKAQSVYNYIQSVFFDAETRKYAIDNSQVGYELQFNMRNIVPDMNLNQENLEKSKDQDSKN